MIRHGLRLLAQGVLIAVVVGLGPASLAAVAASGYVVDDDGAQCPSAQYTNTTDPSGPLQAAIDDAIANNVKTISVCGGTYQAVKIWYAGSLTVKAFNPAVRPVIVAPPTNSWDYVISVLNSGNVVLDGLLVTRTLTGDAAGGLMTGISYYGANGTIQNSIVRDMTDPTITGASGKSILIDNSDPGGPASVKVTVKNNLLDGFTGNGISVGGRTTFTFSGNVLDGGTVGGCGPSPCYGISVYGSSGQTKGKIAQNVLRGMYYGIALTEVGGLSITGNVISDSGYVALWLEDHCYGNTKGSSKNKISGNSFLRSGTSAITITATAIDPGSQCGPHIDQTVISGNSFTATHLVQVAPIGLYVVQAGSPYTASINKTQITGNLVWGFQYLVNEGGTTGTVLKSNKVIQP